MGLSQSVYPSEASPRSPISPTGLSATIAFSSPAQRPTPDFLGRDLKTTRTKTSGGCFFFIRLTFPATHKQQHGSCRMGFSHPGFVTRPSGSVPRTYCTTSPHPCFSQVASIDGGLVFGDGSLPLRFPPPRCPARICDRISVLTVHPPHSPSFSTYFVPLVHPCHPSTKTTPYPTRLMSSADLDTTTNLAYHQPVAPPTYPCYLILKLEHSRFFLPASHSTTHLWYLPF